MQHLLLFFSGEIFLVIILQSINFSSSIYFPNVVLVLFFRLRHIYLSWIECDLKIARNEKRQKMPVGRQQIQQWRMFLSANIKNIQWNVLWMLVSEWNNDDEISPHKSHTSWTLIKAILVFRQTYAVNDKSRWIIFFFLWCKHGLSIRAICNINILEGNFPNVDRISRSYVGSIWWFQEMSTSFRSYLLSDL